jgi:hypothetical protein
MNGQVGVAPPKTIIMEKDCRVTAENRASDPAAARVQFCPVSAIFGLVGSGVSLAGRIEVDRMPIEKLMVGRVDFGFFA